jgi:hypothetical protein
VPKDDQPDAQRSLRSVRQRNTDGTGEERVEMVAAVEYDIASHVDERNGWFDPRDGEWTETEAYRAAQMLNKIAGWLTKGINFDKRRGMFQFAVRCLAMIWVIFPDMLRRKDGKVASLEDMAQTMDLSKCWLSMVAEKFSNDFGFFSRNQKSAKSRTNYADGAKEGWRKRREGPKPGDNDRGDEPHRS